ncbi:TetR family transcriptional regulator C-terminal domain-containing protein [Paenibacillus sp. sptzw28]|uniref:TetR-like C-terminal domain-containing protein n=1 Tax=Paenibacillus sp. sptzw28 TaxID=715179 RepID=UPI001C6E9AF6|nr:TetR-like C-terminal domain-containing protein [Paenibacillus sp. sptzw28]QYR21744.1 TetR family transcriptional regulator C-terminal domain-containing protein [Paenibacillus sp. sptzw28]
MHLIRWCRVFCSEEQDIGIIQHWFESGKTKSPREIAAMITRLVAQGPIGLFGALRGS